MKSLVLIPASTLAFPMWNYQGQPNAYPANNHQSGSFGGGNQYFFFAENLTLIVVPRVLERRVPKNGSLSHLKPS